MLKKVSVSQHFYTMSTPDVSGVTRLKQIESIILSDAELSKLDV